MSVMKILEIKKIDEFKNGVALLQLSFPNLSKAVTGTKDAFVSSGGGLKGALSATKAGASGLFGLIKAHPFIAVTAAITAASIALKVYRKSQEEYQNSLKKTIDTANENIQKYTDEKNSLLSLQSKLEDAKKDKAKLLSIQNELNKAIGKTPGLIDDEENAYKVANEKIRARIKELDELTKKEAENKIKAQKEIFETNTTPYKLGVDDLSAVGLNIDLKEAVKEYNHFKEERRKMVEDYGAAEDSIGIKEYDKKIARYKQIIDGKVSEAKDVFSDYIDTQFENDIDKSFINQYISDLIYGGEYNLDTIKSKIDSIKPNIDEFNRLKNDLISFRVDGKNTDYIVKQIQSIIDDVSKTAPQLAELLQTSLNSVFLSEEDTKDRAKSIKDAIVKTFTDSDWFQKTSWHTAEKRLNDFNKWFDNLSDEDKEIVYKISCDTNVAKESLDDWKQALEKENEKTQKAYIDRLNDVKGLSTGFDLLGEIYEDVLDKENFDWNSIIDNKEFSETFGGLEETYTDFIKTVTNSPDDINACQEAFDALAAAYLWNSEVLAGVTDETRNATVLMLEQMGVANAAAIVDRELALQKEKLAIKTGELADKDYNYILNLYNQAEAGSVAKQAYAELLAEKWLVNENGIKTSTDIDQLIALANSANATTATLERLAKAKSLIAQAEAAQAKADSGNFFQKIWYSGQAQLYNAQAQSVLNQPLEYNKSYSVDFKGSPNSGSNGRNASDSASDKEPEIFNWIEIAINRIEQSINRLKKTASSAYKTVKSKLGAVADEISIVNKEIELQQQAYSRYIQMADSVGLSSELAERVRTGAIDINKYDENTRKLINDYKDWYEKALNCEDAISDLHESLTSLYVDNFNNAKNDFKNQLELAEHLTNQYKNSIDMLEAKGYLESTKYYAALQAAAKSEIETLNNELANLETAFSNAMNSGKIEKYSESWYSMQTEINGVKEEIAKANVELVQYAKTMREVKWGYFDYTQERISQLTQEAEFLIDLLSNNDLHTDKGQLTDEGMSAMGLRAQNYNVYMSQADAYAEELLKIDKEIANAPYNTKLIERREELLKLQQDSIKSAEDEKQAIVDLVKNGIDLELESLQKLIDAYTESLDSAKDLYEYQKKIEEQAANVSSLKKQLSAYENDYSEETRAKIQKLTVELADAERELAESEYDQFISDQKKLLSELFNDYESILNQRLDDTDNLMKDMITAVNDKSELINETLKAAASDVGYTMTQNMQNIWNGATNALDETISEYGDDFSTKFTAIQNVLSSIQANTSAMAAASDNEFQETVNNTTLETTPTAPPAEPTPPPVATPASLPPAAKEITVGGMINASGAKIYSYAGSTSGAYQYYGYDPIYTVLDEKNGYLKVRYHRLSAGATGWFKKSDVKAYKTGGLVDYTGLAQVDGTPAKPELMLNAEDTENFLKLRDLLRLLSSQSLTVGGLSKFGSPTLSGVTDISRMLSALRSANGGNMGTTVGDIKINIPIEKVEDYNDFVTQLQKDRQFENMILSMTVDRIAGGSSLNKNKYKW